MVSEWFRNGSVLFRNGFRLVSEWFQTGFKVVSEWFPNSERCQRRVGRDNSILAWLQKGVKTILGKRKVLQMVPAMS